YFQGGGACFNSPTCAQNPSKFGASDFAKVSAGGGTHGIFSRTDTKNSVADWNMVFVPYCTGDIHVGNAPGQSVTGVGAQQFVGYANVTHYLERLVPTFTGTTHILLTGESGGGFGSALNYDHVAKAWPGPQLDLLDDSGPLVPTGDTTTGLQACQVKQIISLWGLGSTLIDDCGADCSDQGNALIGYWTHLGKTYPSAHFGLVESVADATISGFYGFGENDCSGGFSSETPADFEKGLLDQRAAVASYSNMGSFLFPGTDHTSLSSTYTTRTAGADAGAGVVLEDWVTALVGGSVTNAGP
ncbi:MAG TPA: pectin acetylesterase-family hydrolase, partial [Polyangiaceae bacterium]